MFKYSMFVTLTLIMALSAVAEASPVEVLQSDATLEDKVEACRLISISGDVNAIPVLEPLLSDEQLSHIARYALEPMEGDEASAALRRALSATAGILKAGVIASLGVRRDVAAVPELIPLLNDENGFIVEAAARSLGRIAAPEAITALENAVVQPSLAYATMQALGDGLFFAAENGNPADTARLYDLVYAAEALPMPIRAAALRGAILARTKKDGLPLLLDAITGENAIFFTAALRTALEIEPKVNTSIGIAEVLPTLAEDRKIQVIQTLGELGHHSAGDALMNEFQTAGDIQTRIAALRAAVRLAYTPMLPVLTVLISSENAALVKAAKDGLSYFPRREGDEAVKDLLSSSDVQIRLTAVELISQGALPKPVDLLMQVANEDAEDAVRVAALRGAKEYAGMAQMPALLAHLLSPRSNDEMTAAEEAIKLLCAHEKDFSKGGDIVITQAVYGDLPDGAKADVTQKVKHLVATGALSVDAHNGNFGDTAPNKVKHLRVDYTSNGTPATQTVQEGQTLLLSAATVPGEIVDALITAFATSEGEASPAILRVLASTGNPKAFEFILSLASTGEGALKEIAVRAVCDWPTVLALPILIDWVTTAPDAALKMSALRGTVRLLMLGQDTPDVLCQHYATLLAQAASPNEKKLILSGLANVGHATALNMVLEQLGDETVKAEAVQAAIAIAEKLGASPQDAEVLEKAKALIPELGA